MNRFQRLLAMAGVGLLGAITVTGVMAGPGGVLGGGSSPDPSPPAAASADVTTPDSIVAASEDSPDGEAEIVGDVIECPSGESTNFKFEQSADEFEVTGTLVSFDGTTIVVTGPEGDVTAVVDPNAEIKGDPQPGDAVKVEGLVVDGTSLVATEVKPACEDAADDQDLDDDSISESDACPSGENIQAEFEQDSQEFEVKGALVSLGEGIVVVTGPDGDVTAALDPNAEIEGDPQPGDPVEVEGAVLEDGSLVAHEVESACEDEDDDEDDSDDADEQDESDDDSSSSEDVQSDDDHGDSASHDDSDDDSSGDQSEED